MTTTLVKFPQGKNSYNMLTLKADKRIKYDSVRVLRTLHPDLGTLYADRRKKGVRYKLSTHMGMSLKQKQELVILLNQIYMMNNMSTIAYLHEPQANATWRGTSVCLFVKDWQ